MKTIFENIGGGYTQQGDYLLPNLMLLDENKRQIGVWGTRHRRYLKSSHRVLYYNLLTSGKLNNYLADVERQAEHLFEQTVKLLAEQEQVTEKLKATDMMLWVRKINNIRNRATEIVNDTTYEVSTHFNSDGRENVLQQFEDLLTELKIA